MRKLNLLFLVLFLLTGFSTLSAHSLEESIEAVIEHQLLLLETFIDTRMKH